MKIITLTILAAGLLASPMAMRAAAPDHSGHEQKATDKAAKPYPLKTCLVSGEKLGGMGEAYVFTHEGQEIKLCCKGCLNDFKKEPAKYLKKLQAAEKPAK